MAGELSNAFARPSGLPQYHDAWRGVERSEFERQGLQSAEVFIQQDK